ncbi:unnamed protein product [Bursaphelenchus xylophilus]|uniref:(pine wood nematode) hypothetical protein n=1 Tax=Bursaphelenchus xylophilus TaxID=6326 RepID=A0A1I7RK95_BURXY|nr:unnamed protein product [Bursaphelenchus xylophilus]CAG9131411.1 unnamed protein product [Bursaphelenchus xylophilus]
MAMNSNEFEVCGISTERLINTVPIVGITLCCTFTVFYCQTREFILILPLSIFILCYCLIIMGILLEKPKIFQIHIYCMKFLSTILFSGLVFYMYMLIADTKRIHKTTIAKAIVIEQIRLGTCVLAIVATAIHRFMVKIVVKEMNRRNRQKLLKESYIWLQKSMEVSRTTSIPSLIVSVPTESTDVKWV